MGAGASAGVVAAVSGMSGEELQGALSKVDAEGRAKLLGALATAEAVGGAASAEAQPAEPVAGTGEAPAPAASEAAPSKPAEPAEPVEPAASEAAPSKPAEPAATPAVEPRVRLPFALSELFRCFDADEDGLIGKDEYLECHEKVAGILDESFGPKQRKQKMTWYKDAGAEGTPEEGMFLSREKWEVAFVKAAHAQADIPAEEPDRLAEWLWDLYGEKLVRLCFPSEQKAAAGGGEPAIVDQPAGPCPYTEPCKIPLSDLDKHLAAAEDWGYVPLVLSSHCTEVHTFFNYKCPSNLTFATATAFLGKTGALRTMLSTAMDYHGNCAQVLVKMAGTAFDFNSFCCDDFPADVFSKALWTPKVACEQGFIDEGAAAKLGLNAPMWKRFHLVLTSDFTLQEAKDAKVMEKIPYSNRLAVLEIDPKSVVTG